MVGEDGLLRENRRALDRVIDDLGLVDRHIHVELDRELLAGEVALPRHLEVDVYKELQTAHRAVDLIGEPRAVVVEVHISEVYSRSRSVAEVGILRIDRVRKLEQIVTQTVEEVARRAHIEVRLQFVHAAVGRDLDSEVLLQIRDKLGEVLPAVVLEDVDEFSDIALLVYAHGRYPVDLIYQVADEVRQGQLVLVILRPDYGSGCEVVALVADLEMRKRPVVLLVAAVVLVNKEVSAAPDRERLRDEVFDAAFPPQLRVRDRLLPVADVDYRVVDANEGVKLRVRGVRPDRDELRRRDVHPCGLAVLEVGLKPADSEFDNVPAEPAQRPSEVAIKELVQTLTVGVVIYIHAPRLGEEVVRFLVDELLQIRVLDMRIRAPGDVVSFELHRAAVAVV